MLYACASFMFLTFKCFCYRHVPLTQIHAKMQIQLNVKVNNFLHYYSQKSPFKDTIPDNIIVGYNNERKVFS